jgi:hypothetical protein
MVDGVRGPRAVAPSERMGVTQMRCLGDLLLEIKGEGGGSLVLQGSVKLDTLILEAYLQLCPLNASSPYARPMKYILEVCASM